MRPDARPAPARQKETGPRPWKWAPHRGGRGAESRFFRRTAPPCDCGPCRPGFPLSAARPAPRFASAAREKCVCSAAKLTVFLDLQPRACMSMRASSSRLSTSSAGSLNSRPSAVNVFGNVLQSTSDVPSHSSSARMQRLNADCITLPATADLEKLRVPQRLTKSCRCFRSIHLPASADNRAGDGALLCAFLLLSKVERKRCRTVR